jgi:hypothetical protein
MDAHFSLTLVFIYQYLFAALGNRMMIGMIFKTGVATSIIYGIILSEESVPNGA